MSTKLMLAQLEDISERQRGLDIGPSQDSVAIISNDLQELAEILAAFIKSQTKELSE